MLRLSRLHLWDLRLLRFRLLLWDRIHRWRFLRGEGHVDVELDVRIDLGSGEFERFVAEGCDMADFDKDGDVDVVVTGKWGGPVWFENKRK